MSALRSVLALAAACAVVVLANGFGGVVAEGARLPPGGDARLAWDLAWVVASCVAGAWTMVRLAPCAPRAHAMVFLVMALAAAGYAVLELGDGWPSWFGAGGLLAVAPATWLGARLAARA